MQVRNDGKHEGYYTIRQWAKKGYLPIEGAEGTKLWVNRYCQSEQTYYTEEEVYQATPEQLNEYWKPERQRRANRRKELAAARLAAEEHERQETEAYISQLQQQVFELVRTIRQLVKQPYAEIEQTADVIVLDIETTGLDSYEDEILQISIISDTGKTLYNSYIKPIFAKSWKSAERINHITPEMVEKAPNIYQEMPKINAILRFAKVIVGYNHSGFDVPFLQRFGAVFPEDAESYDVMQEFAPIYGDYSEYHNNYKWQKLAVCAAYYGYDWGNDSAHDSLSDCKATLFCYNKMKGVCSNDTQGT